MEISPLPPQTATLADVDACVDLYLEALSDPAGNQLLLQLVEETRGPVQDVAIAGGAVIRGVHPIGPAPGCRVFEVFWPSYVAYLVRNESYAQPVDGDEYVGRKFRVYERSHYRDFVARATWATDDFPGPLTHWCVLCQDHIVDVISKDEPVITRVAEIR